MAAPQSRVPKFGNWENDQDVPYTQYFDKARKGKQGGRMINPNDPANNLDVYADKAPVQAPFRNGVEPEPKPRHERRVSKEDGDLKRVTDSPGPFDQKRSARQSGGGPDRSVEQSPLHPHHQARTGGGRGAGVSSPSWEKKSSDGGSHGHLAPNTPGRSRLRFVARGDETPDKSAAVPKFGEWDENNPASADGFTHIFNKMREEKQTGTANPVPTPKYNSNTGYNRNNGETQKCGCFSGLFGK
ncbi:hypothetical protein ACHQM5_027962 [Ranunculus cassubicifolius]